MSGWQISVGGKFQWMVNIWVTDVIGRQMSIVCFMAHVKMTNVQNDRHLVTSTWVANILAANYFHDCTSTISKWKQCEPTFKVFILQRHVK